MFRINDKLEMTRYKYEKLDGFVVCSLLTEEQKRELITLIS